MFRLRICTEAQVLRVMGIEGTNFGENIKTDTNSRQKRTSEI
jgi:hypothetical protein